MTYPPAHLKLLTYCLPIKGKQELASKISWFCKSLFTPAPVYAYSICQKSISYIIKKFEQNSVSCEKCNMWYHVECVGIEDKNNVSKESDIWNCINCSVIFKIIWKRSIYVY